MGIAREITQDLFGTRKGLFGKHEPFACAERQQRGRKCLGVVEGSEITKELQFAGGERKIRSLGGAFTLWRRFPARACARARRWRRGARQSERCHKPPQRSC
jgi:hypothetical protein